MATKTFKIGEECYHGIIKVTTQKNSIVIIKMIDMQTKRLVSTNTFNSERDLFMFLTDMSTPFYADKIINWIKNVKDFQLKPNKLAIW